ncbi:MAG: MogA/MoaB family molybdenum cofactor biosynthesis protein [Rhodospirillales bacterium]|nr:MogA/MoaB family molybdenum cofactor biosynthesis protein [Acetobacter sp.]
MRVAILTVSDGAMAGRRSDESGPALRAACEAQGWSVVAADILADETGQISERMRAWADAGTSDLILTTGGTGVAARDLTPEATALVLERTLPGLPELMRSRGTEQTPTAVLSRGMAGTRGRTLIVNLPGSPRGAVFSFGVIASLVPHVVQLLRGHTEHDGPSDGSGRNRLPFRDI